MTDQPIELRDLMSKALRTVAPLADTSASALADDILQRISQAGFRWDETPGQVFLAVTNPLTNSPPNGYSQDAHASVHHTEAGAQRALDNWAAGHPQYRGYISFDVLATKIDD